MINQTVSRWLLIAAVSLSIGGVNLVLAKAPQGKPQNLMSRYNEAATLKAPRQGITQKSVTREGVTPRSLQGTRGAGGRVECVRQAPSNGRTTQPRGQR